jgi:hypothetical protein
MFAHYLQEIKERDSTISEKEKRIYDLKKKNQELEKFKFVLDHKIKELKKQIEPKDDEIADMNEQIKVLCSSVTLLIGHTVPENWVQLWQYLLPLTCSCRQVSSFPKQPLHDDPDFPQECRKWTRSWSDTTNAMRSLNSPSLI